ncbi:unnamed protein product [Linum trigynum]|uniref:Uncharacterized protein n=1 Tax=Linum trigynum TaxID=586398 RepID=A0AAV2FT74_9ROSI
MPPRGQNNPQRNALRARILLIKRHPEGSASPTKTHPGAWVVHNMPPRGHYNPPTKRPQDQGSRSYNVTPKAKRVRLKIISGHGLFITRHPEGKTTHPRNALWGKDLAHKMPPRR